MEVARNDYKFGSRASFLSSHQTGAYVATSSQNTFRAVCLQQRPKSSINWFSAQHSSAGLCLIMLSLDVTIATEGEGLRWT